MAVALVLGPAGATVGRSNGPFKIEWTLTATRAIEGRVYNKSDVTVSRVRVLVEGLDASDRVVDTKLGDVFGDVGPASNRYFTVREVPAAHHYRLSVVSYTLVDDGPQ
jgi:hypothetical protein